MVAAHDVPELEPLEAPQTLEERRARQRLHVKRTYYKKLMEMQALRDTVQQLETEFARLKLQRQSEEAGASRAPAATRNDTTELVVSAGESDAAVQRFNEILALKARLRQENEALQRAISERNRFALKAASWIRVGRLLPAEDEETGTRDAELATGAEPLALSASFSVDMCREVARATFQGVRQFTDSLAFLSTGVSLFGWRDKRIRQGDRVAFSLTKQFGNISALELWTRGWQLTGATNGLSRLYSASMNVSVASVQRVDADNEIKLRVMTSADGRTRVKTLFLTSRFATSTGYVHIIRSLDHTQFLAEPPCKSDGDGVAEHWVDYHNWTIFESQGAQGEHCRLEFGGEVQSNAVAGSDMWMLEVLLVALRWESIVVEPVFKICPDGADEDGNE